MKIAVVGGGITGLTLAYRLTKAGHKVKLFEKDEQLGGLATYYNFGSFYWDKFYHVILPSDENLIDFIKEIGLEDKLTWKQSYTGYYINKKFYSVSNSKEFLFFPVLNPLSKMRLAYTILKASKITNWKKLESITVEEWLKKTGGKKNFEKFWKPLLLAKLGPNYRRVSALFIWTYITRLFMARDSSAKKEHLGYVMGGYKTIIESIVDEIKGGKSEIMANTAVEKINPGEEGLFLNYNNFSEKFDKIVFTGPVNLLKKIVVPDLISIGQQNNVEVEYLGVICLVLITKKPVTKYYVLNIADESLPFTGVIGLSTVVEQSLTDGKYVTYFPKYVLSSDPILKKSDEEIEHEFRTGIHALYPELSENDIVDTFINRAFKVQPLQVLNYSEKIPSVNSKHPDFYILNTSQLVNNTLNNNAVIRHVNEFVNQVNGFKMDDISI